MDSAPPDRVIRRAAYFAGVDAKHAHYAQPFSLLQWTTALLSPSCTAPWKRRMLSSPAVALWWYCMHILDYSELSSCIDDSHSATSATIGTDHGTGREGVFMFMGDEEQVCPINGERIPTMHMQK
ncbi:hypothetical protein FKM82_011000 [Ascaphus truei]